MWNWSTQEYVSVRTLPRLLWPHVCTWQKERKNLTCTVGILQSYPSSPEKLRSEKTVQVRCPALQHLRRWGERERKRTRTLRWFFKAWNWRVTQKKKKMLAEWKPPPLPQPFDGNHQLRRTKICQARHRLVCRSLSNKGQQMWEKCDKRPPLLNTALNTVSPHCRAR